MNKFISYFLLLILIFSLSSCGSENNKSNSKFGGSIKIFAYTPDSFNPIKTEYKTNASLLADTIYCPLIQVEKDLTLTPVIAKTWKFNSDGSKLIITLRDDLKFSDGSKVSAKHAKNVIDKVKNYPNSLYSPVNEYIESCSASENVLTLNLAQGGMGVLYTLDIPIYKDEATLYGCGSYVLKEKKDDRFILKANTGKNANKDFKANIETIEVIYYPNEEAALNAFNASEIDVVSCDINFLSTLSTKTHVSSVDYVNEKFTYLGFNCGASGISDPEIRLAIGNMINKKSLVETKLSGYAIAASSPFRPKSAYDLICTDDIPFAPTKAKQKLEQVSFQSFNLLINKESSSKKTLAEYIKEELRQYGISVQIISVDYDEYLEKINNNAYTAYIGEIIIPCDQNLSFLLHTDSTLLNYSNAEMDQHLTKFASALSESNREKHADSIQKLLLKDVPIISLFYEKELFFVSNKIKSSVSPAANALYHNISAWYVK